MIADIETSDLSESVFLMRDELDRLGSGYLIKGDQGYKGGFIKGDSQQSKSGTSIDLFVNFLKQAATYQWLLEPNSNITDFIKDSFDTFYPIQFRHQMDNEMDEQNIIEQVVLMDSEKAEQSEQFILKRDHLLKHFVYEGRNNLYELRHQESIRNAPPQEPPTPNGIEASATLAIDQPRSVDHMTDTIQSREHASTVNDRKASLFVEVIDHRDRSINDRSTSVKSQPMKHSQQTDRPANSHLKQYDMDVDVKDGSSSSSGIPNNHYLKTKSGVLKYNNQIPNIEEEYRNRKENQIDSSLLLNESIVDEPQLLARPRLSGIKGGRNFANDMRLVKAWIYDNQIIDNGITLTVNGMILIDNLKFSACLTEDEYEAFDGAVEEMMDRTPGMEWSTITVNGLEPFRRAVFYLEAMSIMYTFINSVQELERELPDDIDPKIDMLNHVVSSCNRADRLTDFFSRSSKAELKDLSQKMEEDRNNLNRVDIPILPSIKTEVSISEDLVRNLQLSNNIKRNISSIKSKIKLAQNEASH